MRPAVRQRLSFLIPALACAMCLGSAFAVSGKIERPAMHTPVDSSVVSATTEAKPTSEDGASRFRFASPATLVLGTLGFLAMLKRGAD